MEEKKKPDPNKDDLIKAIRNLKKIKEDTDSASQLKKTMDQVRKLQKHKKISFEKSEKIKGLVIGSRIRVLRMKHQMDLEDLASRMGVSRDYLAKLESGQLRPAREQLETIEAFIKREL